MSRVVVHHREVLHLFRVWVLLIVVGFSAGCSTVGNPLPSLEPSTFSLTIAHLNDTHSHLDPSQVNVKIGGEKQTLSLGGFSRIATLLADLRQQSATILLHAGDAFQGTLYFTKYQGRADWEMLNLLKPDVMTFGNHEFDKGPALVARLMDNAHFPIVAANVDAGNEPLLAGKVSPYAVIDVRGEKIGVIGLAFAGTASISNPGDRVKFVDPVASAAKYVSVLAAKGINKIVVLSHNGYEEDLKLARAVPGVDLVVGAHTHTLLGGPEIAARGLSPEGPYPTVVRGADGKTVLVVTAWEWGKMLGVLDVAFDGNGDIVRYSGRPVLVDQTIAEDPSVRGKLEEFRKGVVELERQVVAAAVEDLPRYGRRNSAILGRVVADSMLWKARSLDPAVTVALQNAGGVRADISKGPISVASVKSVLPFDNTLVVIDLRGTELFALLEGSVAAARDDRIRGPLIAAGLRYRNGRSIVSDVQVEQAPGVWLPLDPAATYRIVTNSYLAGGGDYSLVLKHAAGFRRDLAVSDADAFMEYAAKERELRQPRREGDLSLLLPEEVGVPRHVFARPASALPLAGAA